MNWLHVVGLTLVVIGKLLIAAANGTP